MVNKIKHIYCIGISNKISLWTLKKTCCTQQTQVPITTTDLSWNSTRGEVCSKQHYVVKFVSDLRQVGGFLSVLQFPPPIKQLHNIAEILLKVALATITPNPKQSCLDIYFLLNSHFLLMLNPFVVVFFLDGRWKTQTYAFEIYAGIILCTH